jgi:hypothetical protein
MVLLAPTGSPGSLDMELNIPIWERVKDCRNLLIAGMGGGFDVYCGLPLWFELRRRGLRAHLANFSFTDIAAARGGIRLSPTLLGVTAGERGIQPYFPELHLANWLQENLGESVPVWSFHKKGVETLAADYRILADHLGVDGIVLVDGGVDSLVRGNESGMGTLIEDAMSLLAVDRLADVPVKLLACLGFGAERDIDYAQIFENIATITVAGGFLGSCALTPAMEAYRHYEAAVLHAQGQPYQDPSVINSSIISAVLGEYGDFHLTAKTKGSRLWISPLMTQYWFFDFATVVGLNLILGQLEGTDSFMEALKKVVEYSRTLPRRPPAIIGL